MKSLWKYLAHSTSVYETFSPFSSILKLFGFMSLTFGRQPERKSLTTLLDVLLMGFWLLWYLVLFTMILLWGEQEPESENSLLIKHGCHKLYLFEFIVLAYLARMNFANRFSINGCLRLMDQFDHAKVKEDYLVMNLKLIVHLCSNFSSQAFRSRVNHSKHRSIVIWAMLLSSLRCVFVTVLSFILLEPHQRDPVHVMSLVCNLLGSEMTALVACQFIFFIFCVQQRFKLFTENLLLTDFQSQMNDRSRLIDKFSQQYSTLSSAMRTINDTLSIQVNNFAI